MSISRRNDGRYVVKFKDGSKWKQKTFRAREDAEGFERSIQYDEPENSRLTVSESILLFLKSTKHARKTERAFALALDRMGDTLTGRYVDTLNRRDLEHFRDTLRTEYQATTLTINRTVRLFLAAWRWCASAGYTRFAALRSSGLSARVWPSASDRGKSWRTSAGRTSISALARQQFGCLKQQEPKSLSHLPGG